MTTFAQRFPSSPLPLARYRTMMNLFFERHTDFVKLIQPETPLEASLLALPEFQMGYNWGLPRFGHPEGKVGIHVREVLDNIDKLPVDKHARQRLRLIALSHDTFKFLENKALNTGVYKHHGLLARELMEKYCDDESLLNIIELHDEAFYIWRAATLEGKKEAAEDRLEQLIDRIGGEMGLYFLFFKCDTQTGDKMQAPLYWFEGVLKEMGIEI